MDYQAELNALDRARWRVAIGLTLAMMAEVQRNVHFSSYI